MDYSDQKKNIVTGGKDCCLRIYDVNTHQMVREYEKGDWYAPGHSNRIFSVKFKNDDQNIMISGGWDASIFLWDIRQKK